MKTEQEKRRTAVLKHIADWEKQQTETAKLPYYKDKKIELSYFKTPEQLETCLELVEKYHDKIYTNILSENYLPADRLINVRVVKSIAKAAGLVKPYVWRDSHTDYILVNYEVIDPYGDAIGEIVTIYSVCCRFASPEHNSPPQANSLDKY